MKTVFLLIGFALLICAPLSAQSFDQALELYEMEQYAEAAAMFAELDDENSRLFEGKSQLALGNYARAISALNEITDSNQESARMDAYFSLGIAHFGLKNFDTSLEYLYDVARNARSQLRNDALDLYRQIIDYLTQAQRFEVLQKVDNHAIRLDLVRRSGTILQPEIYDVLVGELVNLTYSENEKQRIVQELGQPVGSPPSQFRYPVAPDGKVFNIGVILPVFDENDPDFTIPRNLYFGILLAADEFNSRNPNQKVNLIFRNSAEHPDTTAAAFKDLVFTKGADAIIGPLFSEPALKLAELSEEYKIPMLAPLANADDLNRDFNYTFQFNPSLETIGRRMAQFAVNDLRLNRLAIIIEQGMMGRPSAIGFRNEAQRLGANITYFIEENFAATGYDISDYTEVFTMDQTLIDSLNYVPSQGIYAPFTGQASETMINLLLNDLEAKGNDLVIFGTEEWGSYPLTDYQQRFFEIYYTTAFGAQPDHERLENFRQDYQTRFGNSPDQFSKVGYDVATFLINSLETAGNPGYLTRALRRAPLYNGLALDIHFDGLRINQNLFVRPLSDAAKERLGEN